MMLLSRYFESFRKRRAIRSYARRLPRLLAKDYGSSKTYTPRQVRKTIERYGLNGDYSCYGVAMFSEREGFDEFHREIGDSCDYDNMRTEIADWYFHGNADFTIFDVAAGFSETGGGLGHGHDAGGHSDGGSGHGD